MNELDSTFQQEYGGYPCGDRKVVKVGCIFPIAERAA